MQKIYCLLCLVFMITVSAVNAQDEGTIIKRERIALSNNIFVGGGMSFTFGSNIGDYSKGYNFDAGYLKRLNRVLSIGGGISYQTFKYDVDKTEKNYFVSDQVYTSVNGYDAVDALVVGFEGGDITMMSLGFIAKVNFVPVKDDSKFSLYGFARPFVSYVTRKEVVGAGILFAIEDFDDDGIIDRDEVEDGISNWGQVIDASEPEGDLKEYTGITGGIFVGPGVELNPGKSFSISLQASVGYTFPVSFISTSSYDKMTLEEVFETEDEYPMTKEGFPSFNIQLGFSYNF